MNSTPGLRHLALTAIGALGLFALLAVVPAKAAAPSAVVYFDGSSTGNGFTAVETNGLTVCPDGSVYIVNDDDGVVYLAGSGASRPTSGTVAYSSTGSGQAVTKVACDSSGNLYLLDGIHEVWVHYAGSSPGALTFYVDFGSVSNLRGFVVAGNYLFASSGDTGEIVRVPAGLLNPSITPDSFATGLPAPGLEGLGTDGTSLFVADNALNSGGTASGIYRFDPAGGPYVSPSAWIDTSSDSSMLPYDVTGDGYGSVYVAMQDGPLWVVKDGTNSLALYCDSIGVDQFAGSIGMVGSSILVAGFDASGNLPIFEVNGIPQPTTTTTTTEAPSTTSATTTTIPASGDLPATGSPLTILSGLGLILVGVGSLVRRVRHT